MLRLLLPGRRLLPPADRWPLLLLELLLLLLDLLLPDLELELVADLELPSRRELELELELDTGCLFFSARRRACARFFAFSSSDISYL